MPTRLQLEIYSHTRRFSKRFKVDCATDRFILYRMLSGYTYAVVAVYTTCAKCYRVMLYYSCSSVRYGSTYTSFRSIADLCVWLDDLPVYD